MTVTFETNTVTMSKELLNFQSPFTIKEVRVNAFCNLYWKINWKCRVKWSGTRLNRYVLESGLKKFNSFIWKVYNRGVSNHYASLGHTESSRIVLESTPQYLGRRSLSRTSFTLNLWGFAITISRNIWYVNWTGRYYCYFVNYHKVIFFSPCLWCDRCSLHGKNWYLL